MDLIGKKFNKLIVIEFAFLKNKRSFWKCVCECGNEKIICRNDLVSNHTKSCGCLRNKTNNYNFKHGQAIAGRITKEYKAWVNMKYRCYTETCKFYKSYGGRGIKVCNRWLDSFENFLNDVGYAPSFKHSIDRINNDGDYEPSNVRWATDKEQLNNRSLSKDEANKKLQSGKEKYLSRKRKEFDNQIKEVIEL